MVREPKSPAPMALTIQKRSWKNADGSVTETWRLIVQDYTSGERVDFYPKREHYLRYGFDPNSSVEDAKLTLKTIQARNKVARDMERKAKFHAARIAEEARESAYLPNHIYSRFLVWLKDKRLWDEIPDKTESHLRKMRDLVIKVDVDPSKWPDRPEKIYRYFLNEKLSLSYVEKVLPLLNEYGYFYCRELGKPFLPIDSPRGEMARRIDDANHDERDGRQAPSKPILPEDLKELGSLPVEQVRWVRISVYFGLRPFEVDRISPKNFGTDTGWKVSQDEKGTSILHLYQHKLVRVERKRRWKRIPCILKEQSDLIQEMLSGLPKKRPYAKTLQSHLGAGVGVYGGRKAFEKMMTALGQDFRHISRWLGHTDINRTEANYRDTDSVEYKTITTK